MGDRLAEGLRTLTPSTQVRILVSQPERKRASSYGLALFSRCIGTGSENCTLTKALGSFDSSGVAYKINSLFPVFVLPVLYSVVFLFPV